MALRTSEQRFHTLADNAPVLIWVSGPDGLFTWFNRQWLDFVGQTMEHELGNGWAAQRPPRRPRVVPSDRIRSTSTHASRSTWNTASAGTTANGDGCSTTARRTMTADGAFTGYLGSCIDITEEKQARQEVERLRDQLQAENVYLRQ